MGDSNPDSPIWHRRETIKNAIALVCVKRRQGKALLRWLSLHAFLEPLRPSRAENRENTPSQFARRHCQAQSEALRKHRNSRSLKKFSFDNQSIRLKQSEVLVTRSGIPPISRDKF
uniref:Integron gene cassette protein n=1 Tax=Globodera pallida TaxID=36090 RepID=A0A183CMU0_GLOPA